MTGCSAAASSFAAASTAPASGGEWRSARGRCDAVDIRCEPEHVHRRFDRHGTGHPGAELVERGVHERRRLRRVLDAIGPLREAAQDRKLVRDLVQQPVALTDGMCRELPGDREHRRAGGPRGGEGCGGVEDPRPRNHDVGADVRARLRVAERHVGGGLLVAGMNDADVVSLVMQRVEHRVELDAGKPEHRVDAVRDQRAHDGPSGRHPRHCVLLKWCRRTSLRSGWSGAGNRPMPAGVVANGSAARVQAASARVVSGNRAAVRESTAAVRPPLR